MNFFFALSKRIADPVARCDEFFLCRATERQSDRETERQTD